MKKVILLSMLLLNFSQMFSQDIQWQKCLGGSDYDVANSIQQTIDGGFIVVGNSTSNDGDVSGNHGGSDFWLTKLGSNNALLWQKFFGGSYSEYAQDIKETTDGGYIIAGQSNSIDGDVIGNHGGSDYWIVKTDNNGILQWQKSLGGSTEDAAMSIQQTSDGGYIIAGDTYSNDGDVSGNNGESDSWIVKLDNLGSIQWQKCLGGSGFDNATDIQQTTDDGYIVAGYTESNDIDVSGNHGGKDFWIVKLDNTGIIQWQKCLGGSNWDMAYSVDQTIDDGFVVTGSSNSNDGDASVNHGYNDYWIVKLDNVGNIQWQTSLGGSESEAANSIQQTTDTGFIVAGYTYSVDGDVIGNHGQHDSWIVKLDSLGALEWQKCLGGSSFDYLRSCHQITPSSYIIAGETESNDGDVSGNNGQKDFWIVNLQTGDMQNTDFNCGDSLYDSRDGEYYQTVLIGNQCWMAENLNVGIKIDDSNNQTDNSIIEKFCFNNIEDSCNTHGGMYQWAELMQYNTDTATQGICPFGWHVPTDTEWKILEGTVDSLYGIGDAIWNNLNYRGYDAGNNLKSTTEWYSNGNGVDNFGFKGTPDGCRHHSGGYNGMHYGAYWWTSNEYSISDYAWYRRLGSFDNGVDRDAVPKNYGHSVRCLKNVASIASLNDSLVAHYPFNSNANDESGNNNNGTVTGATLIPDRFGNANSAYNFDGNDYINCGNGSSLNWQNSDYSVSAWVKRNSTGIQYANYQVFTGKQLDGGDYRGWFFRFEPDDSLYFASNYNSNFVGNGKVLSTIDIVDTAWHHYCGVSDGTAGVVKLYIDGVLNNTDIASNDYNIDNASDLFIGRKSNGEYFRGAIDDIYIYSRALSEAEVDSLYHENNWNNLNAHFIASDTTITLGESIQFTDHTTGNPTSWLWDFGDGTTETTQNPAHIYQATGVYSVSLIVSDGGNSDATTYTNYITVLLLPSLNDSLVAHFPFNGNANDESGNNNNGTVNGATLTTDRFGNANSAYEFDGLNDWIETPILFTEDQDPISITAWINLNDLNVPGYIYGEYHTSTWTRNMFAAVSTGEGELFFDQFPPSVSGAASVSANLANDFGNWVFISFVKKNDTVRFFKNGLLLGTFIHTETYSGSLPTHAGIGARYMYGSWTTLNGILDDIRIYNRAITASEIDSLYHENNWGTIYANFSASDTSISLGNSIQFTDLSTGNPTIWQWDFGDGTTDTIQNPTHNYLAAGTYTVMMVASNSYSTDTTIKVDYIHVSLSPNNTVDWADTSCYTTPTSSPGALWYGDFNNDGANDILTRHNNFGKLSLFLNNGDGSFANAISINGYSILHNCTLDDFNNDGNLDFAVTNSDGYNGSPKSSVYLGNGDGTFQNYVQYSYYGSYTYGIHSGDINNDGWSDIVISSAGWDGFIVLMNDGDGTFTEGNHYASSGHETYHIILSDYDQDGNLDVALSCGGYGYGNELDIFFGNGNGTFSNHTVYASPDSSIRPGCIAAVDFDNQNGVDLLLRVGNDFYIMFNDGNGGFSYSLKGEDIYPINSVDWNNNGSQDVICRTWIDASNEWAEYRCFLNDGNGNFETSFEILASDDWGSGFQLNSDNYEDFTTYNTVSNNICVYFQSSIYVLAAHFSATDTVIMLGDTIQFTDLSTGNPTSWHWNFGDGKMDTVQNPTHVYQIAGNYSVSLVVSDGIDSDSLTLVDYIVVNNDMISCNTWSEVITSVSPPSQYYHSLANIAGDTVLFFGNGETWLFNPTNNWQQLFPSNSPSARNLQAMANIGYGKVLLYGGSFGRDETWLFDLSSQNWFQQTPTTSPPDKVAHSMSYIGDDKVVVFGGESPFNNETWVYDLSDNTWYEKTGSSSFPSARGTNGIAYIGDGKIVIFGGWSGNSYTSDKLWLYNLADDNWTQLTNDGPTIRDRTSMSYLGGQKVLLFGGFGYSGHQSDSWIFDLVDSTWVELSPAIFPPARAGHDLALLNYNGGADVLLFGGAIAGWVEVNDTWLFMGNEIPEVLNASFAASNTTISLGSTIQFTDLSTGNPTSWIWDFGDDITDTTQNPVHNYQATGNYSVSLTVSDGISSDTLVKTDYITVLAGSQTIYLGTGWNIASFYIVPQNTLFDSVFRSLMNENSLTKAIDETGRFMQEIPGVGWLNTIGNMANTEGYYIKVNQNTQLNLTGDIVSLPIEIPLTTGWNIIGYPLLDTLNAMDNLQTMIDSSYLVKVINESGGFVQNIPEVGWVNTIGDFMPGEGYYIKVNANCTLILGIMNPTVFTNAITNISQSSATCGGDITSNGGAAVSSRGVCWSTSTNPTLADSFTTDGAGIGTFVSSITGLTPNTTYHVRAYATNSTGTSYGNENTFTTSSSMLTITTDNVTSITANTATSGGNITYNAGSSITARGVCWSTSQNPTLANYYTTDGAGTGTFVSNISGLTPNTQYYVRAYATNTDGTEYGNEVQFVTSTSSSFSCGDLLLYEGQSYSTVQIGTQCWMAENLNVGIRIDGVNDQTDDGIIQKYCYDNDPANCDTYGGLYQWDEMMQYTTAEGVQGICPTGWHLPTDDEWKILEGTVDSQYPVGNPEWDNQGYRGSDAGGNLKEADTAHWLSPNTGATNNFGFTALPGGLPGLYGTFFNLGVDGLWWSSTESSGLNAWHRILNYYYDQVHRVNNGKASSLSVRCLKDVTPPATVPDPPTIGTATAGDEQAFVSFTAPANDGGSPITSYTAASNPENITGTLNQAGSGTITLSGLTNGTVYTFTVTATNSVGTSAASAASNSVIPEASVPNVTNVTNPATGEIWMDRNLGASQVATSSTDAAAYGNLYQWGRGTDGHQIRTSGTTSSLSSSDTPGHGDFITTNNSPSDWRSPPNDNLWQGVSGTNNPCPSGYRLPTEVEWEAERQSWSSNDAAGAFASPLKLPVAGFRYYSSGSLYNVGSGGYYWSATVDETHTRYQELGSSGAIMNSNSRSFGYSVRCIKDLTSGNILPNPPFLPIPANSSQNQSTAVDLSWSCTDPDGDPLTFDVYFGTDIIPVLVASAIADTTFDPGNLDDDTTYYWKIVAHDDHANTTVGDTWQFSTETQSPTWQCGDALVDIRDNQNYTTVQIGTQCWMAENLNVGIRINGANNQTDNGIIEKYCYDDDVANCDTYGGIYKWDEMMHYVTTEGVKGICLDGWHLPTYTEWNALSDYLGGSYNAGGKMKEVGTTHWTSPNTAATNSSGFTGLPGGATGEWGSFSNIGNYGFWYSSTLSGTPYHAYLSFDISQLIIGSSYSYVGRSVRCLKDTSAANQSPVQIIVPKTKNTPKKPLEK